MPKAKTKKYTPATVSKVKSETKTWGWGVQDSAGKLWREVYGTKQDAQFAFSSGYSNDDAKGYKVVKVWITPVK